MMKNKVLKFTTECDFEANACYIELSRKPIARTVKQVDVQTGIEYVLDFDANGEIVGIEILNLARAAVLGLFGLGSFKEKLMAAA